MWGEKEIMNKHRKECRYIFIWGYLDLMKKHLIGGNQWWVCLSLLSQVTLAQTEHYAKGLHLVYCFLSSVRCFKSPASPPTCGRNGRNPCIPSNSRNIIQPYVKALVSFVFFLTQKDMKTFL